MTRSAAVTRPTVHFTPPAAWLNDPNGLVHVDDEYHVFYQHHPASDVWGPMHWGHAVSTDLLRWQHLPIALEPDEKGTIFSGTAVVDDDDTAGFGAGALLAFFTHHTDRQQFQSVAYSHDRGRTFTKYEGNPILEEPSAGPDFRDPKVFRFHGDEGEAHWIMVVAAGHCLRLYRSDDLLNWKPTSTFGEGQADHLGVFETPDLFPVAVDDGDSRRWILSVGHLSGGPADGSGTRYFIGAFDGEVFVPDQDASVVRWADHGADFYAAQTWSDAPDGRRIWAGWLNNWRYADTIPSGGWRGTLSVPRQLGLVTTPSGLTLVQQPIAELRGAGLEVVSLRDVDPTDAATALTGVEGTHLDIELTLDLSAPGVTGSVELAVAMGADERTVVRYDTGTGSISVDRRASGLADFAEGFAAEHSATLGTVDGVLALRVILDGTSVEVFAGGGRVVISDLIFPSGDSRAVSLVAPAGSRVVALDVRDLDTATG
ncbi:glycoside hydrolase family 32 protein [Nitriliruptor alkaliphilus]|uniref:glycoside hydrolase family 32 protein n=1 Tax=Nitriliruptor alkaliphilus TaxID=427918 RepID=UPI000695B1C6|nr:glycoside hydrolase family 32 protein [Nitriliruptor alkaliphilus]